MWLIMLLNVNPIELQGIVGHKTLHTSATYMRLCLYHTPPNNMGISLSSVTVIIQGEFSVFNWMTLFQRRLNAYSSSIAPASAKDDSRTAAASGGEVNRNSSGSHTASPSSAL